MKSERHVSSAGSCRQVANGIVEAIPGREINLALTLKSKRVKGDIL